MLILKSKDKPSLMVSRAQKGTFKSRKIQIQKNIEKYEYENIKNMRKYEEYEITKIIIFELITVDPYL